MDSNQQMDKSSLSNQPDLSFNLLDLLASLWRWKKQILILMAAVSLGTVVISLFLPNYYTASCTFVPANEDKDLFGKDSKNNSMYGDEEAVDRAIIFANSAPMVDYMVKEFKLAERYAINASTPKGESRVSKRFMKLYNVKKNDHGGIEISMQDKDPQMAAKMLNAAIAKLDALYKQATQPNKDLMMKTYEAALDNKRKELKDIGDSLYLLRRKYAVFDVKTQGELLSTLLMDTESQLAESSAKLEAFRKIGRADSIANLTAKVQGLNKKLEILNSKSDSVNSSISVNAYNEGRELIMYYDAQTVSINVDIAEILQEYTRFKAQASSTTSSIITLEPVQIPKIKSYPVRSIMVLAAAFLSLMIGIMGALVIDLNKRIDWKEVLNK
jgi:capsule polysaccharide export protein KpsE/RkpR